jgi:hypothetical protein
VGLLTYDLVHKLRLISQIYAPAGKLDILNHPSVYAFSDLLVRILAGWNSLSSPGALLAQPRLADDDRTD